MFVHGQQWVCLLICCVFPCIWICTCTVGLRYHYDYDMIMAMVVSIQHYYMHLWKKINVL